MPKPQYWWWHHHGHSYNSNYRPMGEYTYGNGLVSRTDWDPESTSRWWGTVKDREYYHRDLLGSTALLTDKFGMVRERYRYDAFGNHYAGTFKRFNELGYTGKRYDGTTGLYNYGFRDYDAESGRFTTVDPIRDGSNWYAYCGNDPVNKVDLWGLIDAVAIRQTLAGLGTTGLAIPEIITTIAGAVLLAAVAVDIKTDGALSNAVSEVINLIEDKVNDYIEEKKQVRDKEGNPIPPGNRPQSPTGKGANSGPENIGDPGDLGGSGFKPPEGSGKAIAVVTAAAIGSTLNNYTHDETGKPKEVSITPDNPKITDNSGNEQIIVEKNKEND